MLQLSLLLPLVSLWAASVAALSADQIRSVFGSQALYGATKTLPRFDLSVVANASHALYVLNASTPVSAIGWLGTGTGSSMGNADYIVAWPDVSGSSANWTLSHRVPAHSAHDMPELASSTAGSDTQAYFQLVPNLTTTDPSSPYGAVAFLRPLQPDSNYPIKSGVKTSLQSPQTSFIYASGSQNPGSASPSASFAQHDQPHGSTSLNMTEPIVLATMAADTAGPNATKSKGKGGSKRSIVIAHAVLGSVAFLILSPAAVLTARFGRDRIPWLLPHWVLNSLSVACVIATFGLGAYATGNGFHDTHTRLGLALFILVIIQATLGVVGHRTKRTRLTSSRPSFKPYSPEVDRPGFPFVRLFHVLIGLTTIGLGYWQIETGISSDGEWNRKMSKAGSVPTAVVVIFWILVGVEIAAYVVAWVWHLAARATKGPLRDAGARTGRMSDESTLMDELPPPVGAKPGRHL
ncbi:hypothetical protein JCM8202_003380 [Rhodotorula sphaerocarpa]